MKITNSPWIFLAAAVLSVAVHFLIFDFRYMWGLKPAEAIFLFAGYGVCLLLMVLLWIFKPSPIFVALVGLVAFAFPPLLRSDVFVRWDLAFFGFVLVSLLLLAGATMLRRT